MNDFDEYKLDELYSISSGISSKPEQAGHGTPFLSFKTIFNNFYLPNKLDDLMKVNEQESQTYSIKKGDVFLTRTSETLDELAMSSVALRDYPNATFTGFAKRLRPLVDNVVYDRFMAFYFRSQYFRKIIDNNAVMTLRASFNENIFSYIKIKIPKYEKQVLIGDFLYKIEEKRKLNEMIYCELEKYISMLFEYWFIQFDFPNSEGKPYKSTGGYMIWNKDLDREIPHNWEIGTIKELGEIVAGGTPSTKNADYYCDNGIAWITPNDLSNLKGKYISHGERDITELGLKESSAQLIPKGSVLISTRAPIGYIAIALNDVSTNQGFKSIVPKSEFGSEYVYYTIKSNITAIEHLGSGTTFMEVSKDSISKFKLVFPPKKLVSLFNEKIKSTSSKMIEVQLENQKLKILRDWLIPMLMNGQVTLK